MSLPGAVAALLTLGVVASTSMGPSIPSGSFPHRSSTSTAASETGQALASPPGPGLRSSGRLEASPVPASGAAWVWPLDPPPEVVRAFVLPEQRWLPGHRGVDLLVSADAGGSGGAVRAPASGRVRFVGHVAGKPVVVVEHAGGLRSTFEPATSHLAPGAGVTRGQTVGEVTTTAGHCAPSMCLHWGVLRGDTYLDPLALLGPAPVRLLPLR